MKAKTVYDYYPPAVGTKEFLDRGMIIATHTYDSDTDPTQYTVLTLNYYHDERQDRSYAVYYYVMIVQRTYDTTTGLLTLTNNWKKLYESPQFNDISEAISGKREDPSDWRDAKRDIARPWIAGFDDCKEKNGD